MNQFKNLDIRIAKNLIGDIDYVDNDFIVLDDLSKFKIPNDSPIRLGAFTINLYKEYTSLKSRELEELFRFRVMGWQPS